jgi:hypothetical protein
MRPEGLGKFKNHLIGYRTRDLPICSIVAQPLRYRVPFLAGTRNISPFRRVQTDSAAHNDSRPVVNSGYPTRVKRPGPDT